jgi:ribulose-phosphate 3-epimerase
VSSTGLRLAPSILTADFARLGDEIASVAPYVDWVHLDVMDGHYVDNLTFGPDVVAAVRRSCELPLHVHLMISDPVKYAPSFARAGANRISFHPEVVGDVGEAIGAVADEGVGVGLAVHPDVSLDEVAKHLAKLQVVLMMTVRPGFGGQKFLPEVTPKISEASRLVDAAGVDVDVEVDGGVNLNTVEEAVQAGATIIVAGSAIFDGADAPAAARRMRDKLDSLAPGRGS